MGCNRVKSNLVDREVVSLVKGDGESVATGGGEVLTPLKFDYGWVRVNGYTFEVEIAETEVQQARGLMYREELAQNAGMLFVYQDEQFRSFWMKNTLIPLSIAYISEDGKILSIHNMTPLSTEGVNSVAPAKYALEVKQGRFNELKVKLGMVVTFGRISSQ